MLNKRLFPFGTRFTLTLILITGMLGVQPAKSVLADTLTVTNTNDSGTGSLRQAIADAVSGDTITFAPSLAGGTIALNSQITIDKNLTIDGSGLSPQVVLSGQDTNRIMELIIYAEVAISDLTFTKGFSSEGGAIHATHNSRLTLKNSTFYENQSSSSGGAISIGGNGVGTFMNTIFNQNQAGGSGGAILVEGNGVGAFTNTTFNQNQAGASGGSILIEENGASTIVDTTFHQNQAGANGGAIGILASGVYTIVRSTFSENHANGSGGAISGSNITLIDSALSRNSALSGGGAVSAPFGLMIKTSTIYLNHAAWGAAIGISGIGDHAIINSTITQNQATVTGGAILIQGSATVEVSNSSLAHNNAPEGSEIWAGGTTFVDLSNTILACIPGNNSCIYQSGNAMFGGPHNMIGTGTLASFGLAELADNGGPTQTMALLPGSPLIDAGHDTVCANSPVNNLDQRGVTRPQGSHCDIGAYEDQSIVRYVKQDATGTNDGSSWENAYTDLQSALAAAVPDKEIWVAAGTYKPTSGTDRTISFTLKNGVAVYGGFAGNETDRAQRNYETNVTVLSGDIGILGDNSDNSYHVIVGSDTDHSTILDGFTITAGNANDLTTTQHNSGGGMYIDTGSPRLNELIFTDNYARFGGGIYAVHEMGNDHSVDLILTNVVFRNNTATGEGGGMAARFMPDLSSASFRLSLTGVTFENNTAVRTGGGLINYGTELTLEEVTFNGNTAAGGGGLSNLPFEPSTLTNVTFSNNSASDGGGGMLVGSSGSTLTTLTNVTFNNNATAMNGGGLANAGLSNLSLTNVTFSDNTAGMSGGGISNGGVLNIGGGGTVSLLNTTLTSNTANSNGSAVYNESGTINVHNSILYGNSGEEISGTANVTYSMVQGGFTGTGNLDADPLLGPLQGNGGFTQTMALGAGSPAIDAGDDANCPATDQREVTRPQGSHCDIGAYEFDGDAIAPTVISIVRASPNHTSASTVAFTVTFSESVVDVDAGDFTLAASGSITGAAITNVTGSGSVRTVTVNSGIGNGLLGLRVPTGAGITDAAGNPVTGLPFASGESYTILKAATFSDVETDYWAWSFIERLVNAGITAGCGGGGYCPESPVTRAQMAVFLLRGIHGSSYAPPAVGISTGFGDVPTNHWAGAWIKQLAADGITSGCGNGNYCPEASVTRAQMAVFLLRAKHGSSYGPPEVGSTTGFGDVDTNYWAAAWIKQLVAEGITAGCGNNNYCPESPVTRAQMAVFLVRAFGIP